jgi:hypothetical protein
MTTAERQSLHPGLTEATIRLVHEGECYRVVREDGALDDERYRSEILLEPEPCGCDGNQMPVGHQVYRDADRGYAISTEHCEVVAWVVRVEVVDGSAFVWVLNARGFHEIAGIWYERDGELVDNHVHGSQVWTREEAARALRGEAQPSEAVRPEEGDLVRSGQRGDDVGKVLSSDEEGIEVHWERGIELHSWGEVAELQLRVVDQCVECGEVLPDFNCIHCGMQVCWNCAEEHSVRVHSTDEERAYNEEYEARERAEWARDWIAYLLRQAVRVGSGIAAAAILWGPLGTLVQAAPVQDLVGVVVVVGGAEAFNRFASVPVAALCSRTRLARRLLGREAA